MNEELPITRIVKLHFQPERIGLFLSHFDQIKEKVAGSPGCTSLLVVHDQTEPYIVFTISEWLSERFLQDYRASPFFQATWKKIKPWFAHSAEAWTTTHYFEHRVV